MSNLTRRSFLKASMATAIGTSTLLAGGLIAAAETAQPKVRAAVFSPTGGTMNAAYLLASMLCEKPEMIDQTPLSARQSEITFASDELAIFAAPSYAGSIPHAPGLFTNLKGEGTPCILVTAFGNRAAENNFAQMNRIATENGFVVIGAIAMVTPHVFGARAGHSRPDLADHEVIRAFADAMIEKLNSGSLAPIAVEGNAELGDKYVSAIVKSLNAEACVNCGTCAANCPAGAIDASLAINEDLCIHCQRCTHVCPAGARSYASAWDGVDAKYCTPRKDIVTVI